MRLECACLVYLIRQESYNLISFLPKIHLAFLYIEVVLVSFYYILYIQFLQYLKNQTKEYYYSLDTYITLLHLLYWYIKVVVGVMGFISREQVFFFLQPNNTMDKSTYLYSKLSYIQIVVSKTALGFLEKYNFCSRIYITPIQLPRELATPLLLYAYSRSQTYS